MSGPRTSRLSLALACLALVAAGCHKAEEGGEKEVKEVSAKTAAVTVGPFTETVDAIGVVVPRAGSVALLSAPGATRVSNVTVVTGQHVKKGDVLVEFEAAPFQANLQSAEAALSAAEKSQQRAQRLVDAGIAARRELDQATAEMAHARADAVAARRSAQLARLESPIAGVVTKMTAVLGASVDANQPLIEVADPANVDVLANVTSQEATRIHVGATVTLANGNSAGAETLGTATVTEVGGAVDPETRGVPVRARGAGLQRPLRIGESVTARIVIATRERAMSVPVEALIPNGEEFKVFVWDAEGLAHSRPVTVGARTATMAEILKGLVPGERVVTYGAFGVDDGVKVVPPGTEEEPDEDEAAAAKGAKPAAKDEKPAKAEEKKGAKDEKKKP